MDILSTCPMTKTAITTLNKAVEESANHLSWPEDSTTTERSEPILICALGDLEVSDKQEQDLDISETEISDENIEEMRKRVLERLA